MTAQLPTVGYQELDNSGVLPEQLSGAHGVITPTLMGPTDAPVLIQTIAAFKATFGGADETSSPYFPQIKRALQRGCSLYIQRLLPSGAAAAALLTTATNWLNGTNMTITAKTKGAWANGKLGIDFINGTSNSSDWAMAIRYAPNTDIEEVFTGATLLELVTKVNTWSKLVVLTLAVDGEGAPTGTAPSTTEATVFAAGGDDGTWSDDATRSTAITSLFTKFDDIMDMDTLCALGTYEDTHVQDLIEYCDTRKDIIGLVEINPEFTVAEALAFLTGLDAAHSTYVAAPYFGSQLTAYNSELQKDVAGPTLMDVIGVYSYNDTVGARYKAPAGAKRGLIPNVKSFDLNLLAPARKADADALVAAGANVIGNHRAFGPVVWGAATFNKGKSAAGPAGTVSALDAVHVRRMLIDLHRNLQGVYQTSLFDPQNPKTWREAYNKAVPFITKLEKAEAIYPGWTYIGDQGASRVTDARYNKPEDLAVGKYKVLIPLVPVGFISQINFTVQVNSLLSMFQTEVTGASGDMPVAVVPQGS